MRAVSIRCFLLLSSFIISFSHRSFSPRRDAIRWMKVRLLRRSNEPSWREGRRIERSLIDQRSDFECCDLFNFHVQARLQSSSVNLNEVLTDFKTHVFSALHRKVESSNFFFGETVTSRKLENSRGSEYYWMHADRQNLYPLCCVTSQRSIFPFSLSKTIVKGL